MVLGLKQHFIVGIVGYCAAAGECSKPCATPTMQNSVHRVMVDERATPAAPRTEPVGHHPNDGSEISVRQISIGPSPPHQCVKFLLTAFVSGNFGDDLLS